MITIAEHFLGRFDTGDWNMGIAFMASQKNGRAI